MPLYGRKRRVYIPLDYKNVSIACIYFNIAQNERIINKSDFKRTALFSFFLFNYSGVNQEVVLSCKFLKKSLICFNKFWWIHAAVGSWDRMISDTAWDAFTYINTAFFLKALLAKKRVSSVGGGGCAFSSLLESNHSMLKKMKNKKNVVIAVSYITFMSFQLVW